MASLLYQHLPYVVGIVGAGQMGLGIAQLIAQKSTAMTVLLHDRNVPALEKGMATMQKALDLLVRKGSLAEEDTARVMARIKTVPTLEMFSKADFVIEAVTEDEAIKKEVFKQLDLVTPVHAILASNTSSISITRLGAVTSRPHRVVGMHFIHPAMNVPLVELAKGMHTSQQAFDSSRNLAAHLGKTVCTSEDRPGFVVYRTLMPMINEAFFCMMEGVGTPEDIDRGLRLGANMAMGPLKLADHIGLDTCLFIMRVLHNGLGDPKYRPCPLLVSYVDGGWHGVKTGKGVFYHAPDGATNPLSPSALASSMFGDVTGAGPGGLIGGIGSIAVPGSKQDRSHPERLQAANAAAAALQAATASRQQSPVDGREL